MSKNLEEVVRVLAESLGHKVRAVLVLVLADPTSTATPTATATALCGDAGSSVAAVAAGGAVLVHVVLEKQVFRWENGMDRRTHRDGETVNVRIERKG